MTQKVKVLNAQAWQTDSIPGRHVQVEGENLTPQKSPLSSHLPYSKSKQKNTCYMYIHVYIHIHTCEYTYTYLWFLLPLSQIFLGRTSLSIFSLPFLRFCFLSVFPPKYFLFNSFIYRIDIFSTVSADGIKKKTDKNFFAKIDSISTSTCQQQIWNEKEGPCARGSIQNLAPWPAGSCVHPLVLSLPRNVMEIDQPFRKG